MVDIVFALFDIVPGDNRAELAFAAFLSVYLILRQMRFTPQCLLNLQTALEDLHR